MASPYFSHHRVQEAECKQKLPPLSSFHPLQSLLVHDDCVRPQDAGLQASRWFVGNLRSGRWQHNTVFGCTWRCPWDTGGETDFDNNIPEYPTNYDVPNNTLSSSGGNG